MEQNVFLKMLISTLFIITKERGMNFMNKNLLLGLVALAIGNVSGCNSVQEASNVAEYASATAPEMNSEVPVVPPEAPTIPFPASFADVSLDADENVDFAASPLSLYVACSSLGEIAACGETRGELLNAVSASFDVSELQNICGKFGLFATFRNAEWQNRTEPNMLLMSNSLWLSNNFTLNEDSARRDALCFQTKRIPMDDTGRVEINTFVDKMTRGLIPEFIKELEPSTQAILINTLYFYANWQNQFDADKSKEGNFFTKLLEPVKAIYMKDSGFYSGFETENYSAIVLPYEPIEIPGNSMPTKTEMVVLLPKQNISNSTALKAYLNQVVHKNLPQYVEEYYDVVLPKFEINTELNLTKTLAQLGVKKAFSSQADFSKLSPTPLVISDVIQNVSIRVDEKGTEAAAATAIMLMRAMLPPESKPFIVNRPFAFVIREQETSNILFMGTIAKPEAPKAK